MRILIYANEPEDRRLASAFRKAVPPEFELEYLPLSAFSRSFKKKAPGAFVYIDAAGLDADKLAELGQRLGELGGGGWGVIDKAGEIADPASLFFNGAEDYLGPALVRGGLEPERLAAAFDYARVEGDGEEEDEEAIPEFRGWNTIAEGTQIDVRFCYAAIGNQKELLERIGEKRLNKLCADFAAFLEPWSAEGGGIVWIKETTRNLLLYPPRDEGRNPVLAAFRLILDRALVGYEVFRLETPLTFRFAFHAGTTPWRHPGATGTVISEDVNFIFHLGGKAAVDGSIVVSEAAQGAIPACLGDLFAGGGDYEGRSLFVSKRFRD
ncbi:MAG: hypothetical protein JNG85_10060 [Spirochaetaceae bacterium]|nr:hypothetical protein [Spirochaetaceae bacterium]